MLLQAQRKFEHEAARQAPLIDQMLVKMCKLAKQDSLDFHACVWNFAGMGRFGGYQ